MSQKKNTLVGGFAILSVVGILSKVIGIFFQVPLTNLIDVDGQGIFQKVYPTYTWLLAISTAGIPVAISRLVAESVALGRHRQAKSLLKTALILLVAIGTGLMLLLIAVADPLARLVGDPEAALGYRMIAPAVLAVSVMSVFRGYMQGRSRMTPTAVSQLVEQVAKAAISLPLAKYGLQFGLAQAAGYALLGVTIAETIAMLFMLIVYMTRRRDFAGAEKGDSIVPPGFRPLSKRLIAIAVPITIGSMIVPLALQIDSAMLTNILLGIGYTQDEARVMFGALNGVVSSMINVPTVFATAVCIGLVPIVSAARVENRRGDMAQASLLGMRLGSLIGMPCAVGMSMLALPILRLLYTKIAPDKLQLSADILTISALSVFFFTMVQATTGILQGAGLHKVPMMSLVAGVLCKVALNLLLVSIPSVNIFGAPVASIACYSVSMAVNTLWILRKVGFRMRWGDVFLRPAAATAGMAGAVFLMTRALNMERRITVLPVILVAALVYVTLLFAFKALRREDMAQIPGGRKIERLLQKLRVWR